jgi:ankyrin repeat protein
MQHKSTVKSLSIRLIIVHERITDLEEKTPLHFAAAIGQLAAIEVMLNRGAISNINDRDVWADRFALHIAAGGGHIAALELLLEHGSDTV